MFISMFPGGGDPRALLPGTGPTLLALELFPKVSADRRRKPRFIVRALLSMRCEVRWHPIVLGRLVCGGDSCDCRMFSMP
jgi:hypothetical protein